METLEVVVNLLGSTTTGQGLEGHAWLDGIAYRAQASDRDRSLARLEKAALITRHGQLFLPKE